MSAHLLIRAEIESFEDFEKTVNDWLVIAPTRGTVEMEKTGLLFLGIAQGIEAQKQQINEEKEKETTP